MEALSRLALGAAVVCAARVIAKAFTDAMAQADAVERRQEERVAEARKFFEAFVSHPAKGSPLWEQAESFLRRRAAGDA